MTLTAIEGNYSVYRFAPDAQIPRRLFETDTFISITRTVDELSVVCEGGLNLGQTAEEAGWNLVKIEGPLDFGMVGVISSISAPLAVASISIFVISTYDTDYIMVKRETLAQAASILHGAGFNVHLVAYGGTDPDATAAPR